MTRVVLQRRGEDPQTFNSFYIDSKHVAEYTSGKLPIRAPTVDPGLPTVAPASTSGAASCRTTSTSTARIPRRAR